MTFKKIMAIFWPGFIICALARALQIIYTIDYNNGFFIKKYAKYGIAATVVIFAVAAIAAILAFKAYKTPEHPPKNDIALSLSAGAVALALLYEVLFQKLPISSNPAWQMSVVKFLTVICMAYFLALALQGLLNVKIPMAVHTIPFFYIVAKIIFTFISISSLALISDNILLMAGYCLLLLFFINYGKLYNKIDIDSNFRKILATGLSAIVICGAQSVAYFLVNILSDVKYLHIDMTTMLSLLAFSIFTTVFTVSHFKKTV